jgi:hypothetical protein
LSIGGEIGDPAYEVGVIDINMDIKDTENNSEWFNQDKNTSGDWTNQTKKLICKKKLEF